MFHIAIITALLYTSSVDSSISVTMFSRYLFRYINVLVFLLLIRTGIWFFLYLRYFKTDWVLKKWLLGENKFQRR